MEEFEVNVLLTKKIKARSKEEAESKARRYAYGLFEKDSANKHWEYEGFIIEG